MNALKESRGASNSQTGKADAANPYAIIQTASATPLNVNTLAHGAESATHCPATTTNNTSANPISDASSTRPGRKYRKYTPINSAIGIVIASVNVAHGEVFSAFTTTSATTPNKIIKIASTASCAMNPPRFPTSSRAISPNDFPLRRIEQNKITKSCTHPANAAPAINHNVPGK